MQVTSLVHYYHRIFQSRGKPGNNFIFNSNVNGMELYPHNADTGNIMIINGQVLIKMSNMTTFMQHRTLNGKFK